ncbi:MAG: ABC-type dipeptide/oligopeptide/nickel transport system, permease component [halophilic archaeon J07HB67]|nr:MAG: ABC-type dipeptide/oligopeptide/nickel transport system, permease component [halophilic archaeon J07HB67]
MATVSRWRYLGKRLLLSLPVLLFGTTVSFVLVYASPLDPVSAILGNNYTPEAAGSLRESLGLNRPLWEQYVDYIVGLWTLDLGNSWVIQRGTGAGELVWTYLPRTIWLGFWSVSIAVLVGIPLGFYAGLNPNTGGDYLASFGGIVWRAMPNFWLAVILVSVLSQSDTLVGFDWAAWLVDTNVVTPPTLDFLADPAGAVTSPETWWIDNSGGEGSFLAAFKQVLPAALVLGSASMGNEMRIGRTAVLEQRNAQYVETARAKGVPERSIVWKHVFRNAMIPLVPIIAGEAFLLVGGSVLVETVFAINGLGYLFYQASIQSDVPLLGVLVFIFSLLLVGLNIAQDLLYTLIDPRVGYEDS